MAKTVTPVTDDWYSDFGEPASPAPVTKPSGPGSVVGTAPGQKGTTGPTPASKGPKPQETVTVVGPGGKEVDVTLPPGATAGQVQPPPGWIVKPTLPPLPTQTLIDKEGKVHIVPAGSKEALDLIAAGALAPGEGTTWKVGDTTYPSARAAQMAAEEETRRAAKEAIEEAGGKGTLENITKAISAGDEGYYIGSQGQVLVTDKERAEDLLRSAGIISPTAAQVKKVIDLNFNIVTVGGKIFPDEASANEYLIGKVKDTYPRISTADAKKVLDLEDKGIPYWVVNGKIYTSQSRATHEAVISQLAKDLGISIDKARDVYERGGPWVVGSKTYLDYNAAKKATQIEEIQNRLGVTPQVAAQIAAQGGQYFTTTDGKVFATKSAAEAHQRTVTRKASQLATQRAGMEQAVGGEEVFPVAAPKPTIGLGDLGKIALGGTVGGAFTPSPTRVGPLGFEAIPTNLPPPLPTIPKGGIQNTSTLPPYTWGVPTGPTTAGKVPPFSEFEAEFYREKGYKPPKGLSYYLNPLKFLEFQAARAAAETAYRKKYGGISLLKEYGYRVPEFFTPPARALRPNVTLGDISKLEWILFGAQVVGATSPLWGRGLSVLAKRGYIPLTKPTYRIIGKGGYYGVEEGAGPTVWTPPTTITWRVPKRSWIPPRLKWGPSVLEEEVSGGLGSPLRRIRIYRGTPRPEVPPPVSRNFPSISKATPQPEGYLQTPGGEIYTGRFYTETSPEALITRDPFLREYTKGITYSVPDTTPHPMWWRYETGARPPEVTFVPGRKDLPWIPSRGGPRLSRTYPQVRVIRYPLKQLSREYGVEPEWVTALEGPKPRTYGEWGGPPGSPAVIYKVPKVGLPEPQIVPSTLPRPGIPTPGRVGLYTPFPIGPTPIYPTTPGKPGGYPTVIFPVSGRERTTGEPGLGPKPGPVTWPGPWTPWKPAWEYTPEPTVTVTGEPKVGRVTGLEPGTYTYTYPGWKEYEYVESKPFTGPSSLVAPAPIPITGVPPAPGIPAPVPPTPAPIRTGPRPTVPFRPPIFPFLLPGFPRVGGGTAFPGFGRAKPGQVGEWIPTGFKVYAPHPLTGRQVGYKFFKEPIEYGAVPKPKPKVKKTKKVRRGRKTGILSTRNNGKGPIINTSRQYVPTYILG